MIEKLKLYSEYWTGIQKLADEDYFKNLSEGQAPEYLWIGCSDSRVPAETLLGLKPGQLFVHRNIANQVKKQDNNSMSVIQYAVDVLKVRHIIICGHSGCGGVKAAYEGGCDGYLETWLKELNEISLENKSELDAYETKEARLARLNELNVAEQVKTVCNFNTVKAAWERGQNLTIHGWVFHIDKGDVEDLNISCNGENSCNN